MNKPESGVFALESPTALLKKCEFDFEALSQNRSWPQYDYKLFDLVIGINHLFEWYLKDNTISDKLKKKCIVAFNPYASLDNVPKGFLERYERIKEFPTTNSFQEIIRKLCNKSKHFNANKIEIPKEVSSDVCGLAVCGASVCGGVDYYEYYIEVNDNKYNLENLIVSQLKLWQQHINSETE